MLIQVLVLGIACTMSDWTPRLLRALAVDREVIIYDNAGIGQSTISAGQDPPAADYFKFQADTLAGLISDLSLDQPDVLGWCVLVSTALRHTPNPSSPRLQQAGSQPFHCGL